MQQKMFMRRRQAEQTHENDMRKSEETGVSKAKAKAEPEKRGSDGSTQFDAERQADTNDKIRAAIQHEIINETAISPKMKHTVDVRRSKHSNERGRNECLSQSTETRMKLCDCREARWRASRRKKAWRQEKKCGKSQKKLSGRKSASHSCRTKSTKKQWQMRKRKQNFRDCRLEKKEEVAMHRKRWIVAWRRWWNSFSPWERGQGMYTLKTRPSIFTWTV